MPVVQAACADFGKDEKDFTVVALLPAYTGDDLADQRAGWRRSVESYRLLPYYRHVLDMYGDAEPDQLALFGTPGQIQERLAEFRAAGCLPAPSPTNGTDDEFIQTVEAIYGS
jgi:alkanesulfonate monooxygenase SsuD/methylene tetrahydromethanopterin reductase-like flavin-dependent oxidoreductase (luciferase family)